MKKEKTKRKKPNASLHVANTSQTNLSTSVEYIWWNNAQETRATKNQLWDSAGLRAEVCECEFAESWAEHCKCEFYESWVELCECEFYGGWALRMWILWERSITNVNFMQADHFECEIYEIWVLWSEFYESWVLWMWFFESGALWMWILWEQSIANVNFLRAELYECEIPETEPSIAKCKYYESWALWMWILRGLSFVNVNCMWAELCKCDFFWELSWARRMWIFLRAEHCECEFYESWALRMRILWELSIVNVNFMRAELYECKFHELSFSNVNFMRHEHCEYEFYELSFAHVNFYKSWTLRMWILWELSWGWRM